MRVSTGRWGEITIKKQSKGKNNFDATKSFSITNTKYVYSIEELREILNISVNLTEKYNFKELKKKLEGLDK